jgi:hypothetical protein
MGDSQVGRERNNNISLITGVLALALYAYDGHIKTKPSIHSEKLPTTNNTIKGTIHYPPKPQSKGQPAQGYVEPSKELRRAYRDDRELGETLLSAPLKALENLTEEWKSRLSSPPMRLGFAQAIAKMCPLMPYFHHIHARHGASVLFSYQPIIESRGDIFAHPRGQTRILRVHSNWTAIGR